MWCRSAFVLIQPFHFVDHNVCMKMKIKNVCLYYVYNPFVEFENSLSDIEKKVQIVLTAIGLFGKL